MRCENLFYIYFKDKYCTLDEISLDIQGSCTDCIYVDIENEYLDYEREKLLNKLNPSAKPTPKFLLFTISH